MTKGVWCYAQSSKAATGSMLAYETAWSGGAGAKAGTTFNGFASLRNAEWAES